MTLLRDIPDDTPENSVKNIVLILKEEADQLGATFHPTMERQGIAVKVTIDVTRESRNFRLFVSYVESQNFEDVPGSIGNGFISAGQEQWDLELLPSKLVPYSPPFRWGLYPLGGDPLSAPPSHRLDGTLLRRLLKQSLSSQPPA